MATKTVVCPDCGAPAAPGRYACAECGSLLAAVGPVPRVLESIVAADAPVSTLADTDDDDDLPAAPEGSAPAPEPVSAAAPAPPAAAAAQEPDAGEEMDGDFDERAPLAASRAALAARLAPPVLHDVAPGEVEPASQPADAEPSWPEPGAASAPASAAAAPSWPPPGDLGTIVRPEPRTPAGSYLPPSAVLPPLDAPLAAAASASAAGAAIANAPQPSMLDRTSEALSGALGSFRVAPSGSRRVVLIGAAVVALGLLLPWVNTLPGSNPFANYLERWGLAGPGVWLVLLAAVVLVMVAGSAGRPATWALRLPAVALAAFAVGLVWPYLMGGSGRAIGVWAVLVGAIVLAAGGLLERGDRHAPDEAAV